MQQASWRCLLLPVLCSACGDSSLSQSLFLPLRSCPQPLETQTFQLQERDALFTGPDALATPDDYVLRNNRAAFVIQHPSHIKSYYAYGGIPIDAVALDTRPTT